MHIRDKNNTQREEGKECGHFSPASFKARKRGGLFPLSRLPLMVFETKALLPTALLRNKTFWRTRKNPFITDGGNACAEIPGEKKTVAKK